MIENSKIASYEGWLKERGLSKASLENPLKAGLVWQLTEVMKRKKLTKLKMAAAMKTSRAQLDRVLDPKNGNVTIATLERAAKAVGRKLRMEFV